MGQATSEDEVLSSVQIDPKSPPRQLEVFVEDSVRSTRKLRVSAHAVKRDQRGALIDRGANGGIVGNDAHIIHVYTAQEVDVTGIDNHEINSLEVVDACAKLTTQRGEIIGIFRQYAYHGKGRTIHSSGQLEWYNGNKVKERSMNVGGSQNLRTLEGYVIPIDIINGLPYVKMVPNTKTEYNELPHVFFTSSEEWNPKVLDCTISDNPHWFDAVKDDTEDGYLRESPFDMQGDYKWRYPKEKPKSRKGLLSANTSYTSDTPSLKDGDDDTSITSTTSSLNDFCLDDDGDRRLSFRECFHVASNMNRIYVSFEHDLCEPEPEESTNPSEDQPKIREANKKPVTVKKKKIDYSKYRDHFLGMPVEKIKATFDVTTQYATNVVAGNKIIQTTKSPWPANNVRRRNEPVATDTVFATVPAIDDGSTMAQIFVGRKTLVADAYGMKSTAAFVNTLEDNIRQRGAMDKLITDGAKTELSARVKDVLRNLCVDDWHSEANY